MITLLFVSCTIETLSNGQFDGYWHMQEIVYLNDGKSENVIEERIFWSVEGKLLQVNYIGNKNGGYSDFRGFYMRFSKSDNDLILFEPYINGWHEDWGTEGGDTPLEDFTKLLPYGIYNIPEHFTIEKLTNSKMVLTSDNVRLYFVKQ